MVWIQLQMPKGVRLCSVFKAAFYSVMRDSAKKDVEEKRLRLQRRAGGAGTHNRDPIQYTNFVLTFGLKTA